MRIQEFQVLIVGKNLCRARTWKLGSASASPCPRTLPASERASSRQPSVLSPFLPPQPRRVVVVVEVDGVCVCVSSSLPGFRKGPPSGAQEKITLWFS